MDDGRGLALFFSIKELRFYLGFKFLDTLNRLNKATKEQQEEDKNKNEEVKPEFLPTTEMINELLSSETNLKSMIDIYTTKLNDTLVIQEYIKNQMTVKNRSVKFRT